MAVCEFGVIKVLLYKKKSVPQKIMVICEFGVIKGGDRSGENCIFLTTLEGTRRIILDLITCKFLVPH